MKKNKNKVQKKTSSNSISFPSSVLKPVNSFLQERLRTLQKRKKDLKEEDPFSDASRTLDNAAPDTEADEQFGHARTSALNTELSKRIIQVRKALARVKIGKYGICEECGKMIDTDRLIVYPEATLCAKDAKKREK